MNTYKVTKEIVVTVKAYLKDHPNLTHLEVGKLTGVSGSTVSRIRNGQYDYLIDAQEQAVTTSIPYEEFRRLLVCEAVVKDILNGSILSENENNMLYLSFTRLNKILNRHIPELVETRLSALKEE